MYALVDCNNFYASCERVFNPALNNKPIVVLSNNDGCVIARSNEAKALNIPMGAPAFHYEKEFKAKGIHVFSSNYTLYGDMSSRVMHILAQYSPEIEIYSIDEAFLRFQGFEKYDFDAYGLEMKRNVTRSTGIPVSIGFGSTKALSKVANRIAKKYKDRTGGVYCIDTEEKRIKALKWLEIGDVWGIGRKHAKKLIDKGVHTAFQFTELPPAWIQKTMSIVGLRLYRELRGEATLGLETPQDKKAIATTRSFDHPVYEFRDLFERVSTYASHCAQKLRSQGSNCHLMHIFIRTSLFNENDRYSNGITLQLPFGSNSSFELAKVAKKGLERIYESGHAYKKAGVIVMGLSPEKNAQLTLFDQAEPKHRKAMYAMDHINYVLGNNKVKIASQSLDKTFKMRQEHLSKRYSTRLDEVIQIRC